MEQSSVDFFCICKFREFFENHYFDFIIPFYLNMRSIVYSCNDRTYTEFEYCDISRLNKNTDI